MATMDVFNNSAFSATSLSGFVQKMDYRPQLLGSLGLFTPKPVRTRNVFVDRTDGGLTLIPTSPDGAPPASLVRDSRDAVPLRTTRLAKEATIYAHEVDSLRASGTETELMAVQAEFANRFQRLRDDMELTHEHMRLGALQGVLLDSDGVTVIYDYSAEFNEAIPAAISFELNVTTTNVLQIEKDLVRGMLRSGRGSLAGAQIHAICGDQFFDSYVSHASIEKFYLNHQAALGLREQQGQVFQSFRSPSGITYHNYRGTDDNSTVAVALDEAKFFPVGARDVFSVAYSPLETMDFINTPGQSVYALTIRDLQRNMWVRGEIYSYPLFMCQQPRLLRRGTLT